MLETETKKKEMCLNLQIYVYILSFTRHYYPQDSNSCTLTRTTETTFDLGIKTTFDLSMDDENLKVKCVIYVPLAKTNRIAKIIMKEVSQKPFQSHPPVSHN